MRFLQKSVAAAVFLFCLAAAGANAQEDHAPSTQLEPAVSVSYDLDERIRLLFLGGREKNEELESGKEKISFGINYRTKPLFKRLLDILDTDKRHVLVFGAGYEYAHSSEREVTKSEHKIMLDATVRWTFRGNFLLSNRNRFETRWVDGDAHFRVRERLILERTLRTPVKNFRRKFTPFITGEAFWDQRYKKWNIFRYGMGVQIPLFPRTSLDFIYERMRCVTCSDPNTNIFTMRMNLFLLRKKK